MRTRTERLERFTDLSMPEPMSGCHIWLGEWKSDGYGECWVFGQREMAHRAAYREFVGPIPDGLVVRHKCDNRACVNPGHLCLGTQKENVHDAVRKGRHCHGTKNGMSKLTDNLVREIRASSLSTRAWARKLGISQPAIMKARRGETWAHVRD